MFKKKKKKTTRQSAHSLSQEPTISDPIRAGFPGCATCSWSQATGSPWCRLSRTQGDSSTFLILCADHHADDGHEQKEKWTLFRKVALFQLNWTMKLLEGCQKWSLQPSCLLFPFPPGCGQGREMKWGVYHKCWHWGTLCHVTLVSFYGVWSFIDQFNVGEETRRLMCEMKLKSHKFKGKLFQNSKSCLPVSKGNSHCSVVGVGLPMLFQGLLVGQAPFHFIWMGKYFRMGSPKYIEIQPKSPDFGSP